MRGDRNGARTDLGRTRPESAQIAGPGPLQLGRVRDEVLGSLGRELLGSRRISAMRSVNSSSARFTPTRANSRSTTTMSRPQTSRRMRWIHAVE